MNNPDNWDVDIQSLPFKFASHDDAKMAAEWLNGYTKRYTQAVTLLRSWCAGNGDERFVTKEHVRELIEATGDFLKDEK